MSQEMYCDDPGALIAEMIQREEVKLERALAKQEKWDDGRESEHERVRKEALSKYSAGRRDEHRARTAIRSLKEALGVVLLADACKDGKPHPLPDVDEYLTAKAMPPV